MKEINKGELISYFKSIDFKLKGITKIINIYCAGGTALTLKEKKVHSKDIDIVVSREDCRTLSGITAQIERKDKIRIDYIIDGEFVDYYLPFDYKEHSEEIGLFENFKLYTIGDLDIVLMKALAGRPKDYFDTKVLIKKITKGKLLKRFEQLRFKKGKRKQLEGKLNEFIERMDI